MALDNSKSRPEASSRRRFFYGWYLVAASWLTTFLVYATAPGIFFKPFLDEFQWDRPTLSLISSIVMLIFAGLSPFIGRLIDRFGPRIMLTATGAAQALSSVACGFAGGLAGIFIGRFLYELKPTHATQVLINRWFVRKRGQALGILSTSIPLGQLVLSPVSQYLITTWGWRETFYFWAALTALLALPLVIMARDYPARKGLQPDGEAIESPAVEITREVKIEPERGLSLKEALKSRGFWLLFPAHLICGITCGLMATHIVIFATDLGYTAIIGASFLSVQGGVSLLGVLVTGVMSDRLPRNKVLSLTHLIRSSSLFLLAGVLFAGSNSLPLLYLAMAVFGFGWFTTSPLAGGLVADLFGNLRMGTLLGMILSSHIIGMAIGTYAGGITYQLTGSYRDIFLAAAIFEFMACVLVFFIRKK